MPEHTRTPAGPSAGEGAPPAEGIFRDELTRDLEAMDAGRLNRLFAEEGLDAPVIDWSPEPERLLAPPLPFLLRYWRDLPQVRGLALASAVDPRDMQPALGFLMLLDVIDGGRDFRYRLYGTMIAERAGFDMTGRRTSELRPGSYVSLFFLAVYRAAMARRAPIYTCHTPPLHFSTATWDRLVLPLADETGQPVRILCGNVPGVWRSAVPAN